MLSQGVQTIMVLTDRIILSMKSPVFSTAATTAGFTAICLACFFIQFLQFSTSLVARAYGRGSLKDCNAILSQGMIIAVLSIPVLLLASLAGNMYFKILGHPIGFRLIELDYFYVMIFAQISVLFRSTLEAYLIGVNRSHLIFYSSFAGAAFNIPVSYYFTLGPCSNFFEGASGAAWGTFLGNVISLLFLIASLYKSLLFCKRYFSLKKIVERMDFKFFVTQGFFVGLEKFTNSICFVTFVNMFVYFGEEVSAAVAIVFTWDQIAFLPLVGMYGAQMSIYSRYMGQKRIHLANKSLYASITLAIMINAVFSLFFLLFAEKITTLMLYNENNAINTATATLYALFFLKTTCFYIFSNAFILLFKAVLRSLGYSAWCFRVSFCVHLLLVSISYVGIFYFNFKPSTVWFLFLIMTGTLAALFVSKYYFVISRKRQLNWGLMGREAV